MSKLAKAVEALAREGPRQGVKVAGRALGRPASLGRHQWPWRSRWTEGRLEKTSV